MSDGYCWSCGGHDERILVANGKAWCRECGAGEIELLVAAIASWKAEEVEWKETEAKLLARVEELEKMRGAFEAVNKWQNALNDKDRRIEELEADCALKDDIIQGCGHVLNTEMIDAAVEYAEACWSKTKNNAAWLALNKLNIFRCEGEDRCNGLGWVMGKRPGDMLMHKFECPDCDGHGWVIGGEDG